MRKSIVGTMLVLLLATTVMATYEGDTLVMMKSIQCSDKTVDNDLSDGDALFIGYAWNLKDPSGDIRQSGSDYGIDDNYIVVSATETADELGTWTLYGELFFVEFEDFSVVDSGACASDAAIEIVEEAPVVCEDTTWEPAQADYCTDETFTQTSNCGNTREVSGTDPCGTAVCGNNIWEVGEQCDGDDITEPPTGYGGRYSCTSECTLRGSNRNPALVDVTQRKYWTTRCGEEDFSARFGELKLYDPEGNLLFRKTNSNVGGWSSFEYLPEMEGYYKSVSSTWGYAYDTYTYTDYYGNERTRTKRVYRQCIVNPTTRFPIYEQVGKTYIAQCGDGVVNNPQNNLRGEQCDDGNVINGDGCDMFCQTICGDGIVMGKEQCDDQNTDNDDGCRNDCTVPVCGDRIKDPGEECDNGEWNGKDGWCKEDCTYE